MQVLTNICIKKNTDSLFFCEQNLRNIKYLLKNTRLENLTNCIFLVSVIQV